MALILGLRYLFGGSNTIISRSGCLALPRIRGLCTRLLTKLYVGGLSGNTNEQILRDAFSRYGQVLDVSVKVNPQTGVSKGYGFVQFASETEANNALNKMDGKVLDGKNVTVNFAKPVWQYTGVDPPRAVGPPSWVLEKNEEEEEEKVGEKGKEKKDIPRAVGPPSQVLEKNEKKKKSKKKEKNEKKEKKKKLSSSLDKQTFI